MPRVKLELEPHALNGTDASKKVDKRDTVALIF